MVMGSGSGYGSGDGSGYGYGDGSGSGYGDDEILLALHNTGQLRARLLLTLPNAEVRREWLQKLGPNALATELAATVQHSDLDGHGNPRSLLRLTLQDARLGYVQVVKVVCPTTGRVYHLGVPPTVLTCQDAVASTFALSGREYHPVRET